MKYVSLNMNKLMKNEQVVVFIANDLDMGLGKVIAQASHAAGKVWLDRFEVIEDTSSTVKMKASQPVFDALARSGFTPPRVVFCPAIDLPPECQYTSTIIDSGRTVFNKPTLTAAGTSSALGVRVDLNSRLGYEVGSIPFKQAFFINRPAVLRACLDELDVISTMSYLSLSFIFESYDYETGLIEFQKDSNIYQWLTTAFGKTVVATKKVSKFDCLLSALDESGVEHAIASVDSSVWGIVSEVLASENIHDFTKFKGFNLLNKI